MARFARWLATGDMSWRGASAVGSPDTTIGPV